MTITKPIQYLILYYSYHYLLLFINLQNPKSASNQKPLPVMVWIYGGAFEGGDAGTDTYGPDYLLENDVVVVSFNYRLGLFGMKHIHILNLRAPTSSNTFIDNFYSIMETDILHKVHSFFTYYNTNGHKLQIRYTELYY